MTDASQLDLRFARRGDRTVLDRRLFSWPFTLTRSFHLDRNPAHMLTVMVQTSSGAIQAGDRLVETIHVEAGAAAHVASQGATAVHRASEDTQARETVVLEVEAGALLEYWPEPKILFPEAALSQSLDLRCRPGGTALIADAFMLHEPADGGYGLRRFDAQTIVRGDGPEPLLIDRMALDALPASWGRRGHFRAFGNVYAILPPALGVAGALCDRWNEALGTIAGLYAAASPLPNGAGVGLRFAAEGGIPLREALDTAWASARESITGERPAPRRR